MIMENYYHVIISILLTLLTTSLIRCFTIRKHLLFDEANENNPNKPFNSSQNILGTYFKEDFLKGNSEESWESDEHLNFVPTIKKETIKMPKVSPKKQDTYLCYAQKLPNVDRYIVEFQAKARQEIAHHILLFGCKRPYNIQETWMCSNYTHLCQDKPKIMYAWAKNAEPLTLPKDVGIHVGGDSGVDYLVLQVHYLHVSSFLKGATDSSGVFFKISSQRPRYFVGIFLLGSWESSIPPLQEVVHIDTSCHVANHNPLTPKIYPFRFRVHAHSLGVVITAYRIRNGKWTLIGRGDPQRPQAFNPSFNVVQIENGDHLVGRCTYNSMTRSAITHIGPSHHDEMCNFYLMYFYESPKSREESIASKEWACEFNNNYSTLTFPKDSDTPLDEMERRYYEYNSMKNMKSFIESLK